GDRYVTVGPLRDFAIPTTLHDSLMARLDRLSAVKEVAQIGAAIGREFTYRLLAAVAPISGNALQSALEQLTRAGLIFRRGEPPESTYIFKHAQCGVREPAAGEAPATASPHRRCAREPVRRVGGDTTTAHGASSGASGAHRAGDRLLTKSRAACEREL